LTDGLHVRPSEVSFLETRVHAKNELDDDDDDSFDVEDADVGFVTEPSFPVIESAIDSAIEELGGTVFPKLCKAPTDAAWISYTHDLRCKSADEVLTLLKCSERVTKYVSEHYRENWKSIQLELREWIDVHPGGEWRCFVRDGTFLAATPRDISCNVALTEQDVLRVKELLSGFFQSQKCLRGCLVMDIYIDANEHLWVFDVEDFHSSLSSNNNNEEGQQEEENFGLFSRQQIEDLFSLRDLSELPVLRRIASEESCLFHNRKKWTSGVPWELRTSCQAARQVVEEAVSFVKQESYNSHHH